MAMQNVVPEAARPNTPVSQYIADATDQLGRVRHLIQAMHMMSPEVCGGESLNALHTVADLAQRELADALTLLSKALRAPR